MQRAASIPCYRGFATTLGAVTTDRPGDQLEPDDERVRRARGVNAAPPAGVRSRAFAFLRSPVTASPRAREGAGAAAAQSGTGAVGLDEREYRLSMAATLLALGLVGAGYIVNHHSPTAKIRADALTLLIAGLVLIAVMIAGIVFRRGSMVGIASFMMGFELISAEDIFGAVFLIFGGWLIVRSMRRQRAGLAAGSGPARATRAKRAVPSGPPKPSKRYTPPRRSRAPARRR